jgi:acetylornithine deacetylase
MTSSTMPHTAEFPWVEALVRMDTTSRLSNLGLIECVRDYFAKLDLTSTLTYNRTNTKANLFATVPSVDGSIDGGIVLSGHTDVVPVEGQDWSHDPFDPLIRDGRLYGRGSCDMKGFIGVALDLLPEMRKADLQRPIHFALSYDEEIGCAGAPSMIEDIVCRGVRPDGCIVGEPSNMRLVTAHKGINAYRCSVHGRAAHSSLQPEGVNAIEYAARLSCYIHDLAESYRSVGPFDDAFDVPYTTAQTGIVTGGIAVNTIPALCELSFEFRNLPNVVASDIFTNIRNYAETSLLPRMRSASDDVAIRFEELSTAPSLDIGEHEPIVALVRNLLRDKSVNKVAYATEAGLFHNAGIPSIVCGPGNILQAHKPDEFIELKQLSLCDAFLRKLIESLCEQA